jgi:hypothetical protein
MGRSKPNKPRREPVARRILIRPATDTPRDFQHLINCQLGHLADAWENDRHPRGHLVDEDGWCSPAPGQGLDEFIAEFVASRPALSDGEVAELRAVFRTTTDTTEAAA